MEPDDSRVSRARSLLFVPGSRPDRFDKAAGSGADLVVLDLEDAVETERKSDALAHVVAWVAGGGRAAVRINGAGTTWHEGEIAALRDLPCELMVPKAEDALALATLARQVSGRLIALVETARGVTDVDAIAASGVSRLALGTIDLATELGVDPESRSALDYARGRMVMASAAAGLPSPVDGVTTVLGDSALLESDTRWARELGFGGKLCIHPSQVAVIHEALRPTEQQVSWANRVVTAARSGAVSVVDGAMVDAPVVARANGILARAGL